MDLSLLDMFILFGLSWGIGYHLGELVKDINRNRRKD
jgi:hypothetical protein